MKILLLGATGRTGQLILRKALDDGHQVVALVREPDKLERSGADLVTGSPYDHPALVRQAMTGCDAVVNTLNVSRTSDNPWSKLRSPLDMISKSVKHALIGMEQNGVRRIVSLSTQGAGDSKEQMPIIFNLLVAFSNLKYAFADHTRQENELIQSDTDWTVLRLPMLTDEPGERELLINNPDGARLNKNINRETVARFILSILNKPEYFKKLVGISYK